MVLQPMVNEDACKYFEKLANAGINCYFWKPQNITVTHIKVIETFLQKNVSRKTIY